MNIHLAYYSNIGPFANQNILVHFPEGKYMIQSPVGTGKSFLFFDGLIYGLYKYSDRNIVNANCKEGQIYIVFEVDDIIYMLHRSITTTSTKIIDSSKVSESTKSKLYIYDKYDKSKYFANINKKLPHQIVSKSQDISDYININDWGTFDFKNEIDLNNNLKELLPLREVFVNRNIFMQDSEDIFQVQEAERLRIFKNIFSLQDIDKIKDELSGRAKEIKGMISAKKNNDNHNENFSIYISDLLKFHNQIKIFDNLPKLLSINSWIEENQMFLDKMTMDKLDINHLLIETSIYEKLSEAKVIYQDFFTQKQVLNQQLSNNQSEIKKINLQIDINKNQIYILTEKIGQLDPKRLDDLKSQKDILINQKNELQNIHLKNSKISDLGLFLREDLINYINKQIQSGKDLKLELSENQNKLQSLVSNYQNLTLQKENLINSQSQKEKFTLENQKNKLNNQIINLQNQITNNHNNLVQKENEKNLLILEIKSLEETLVSQNKFYCAKIEADCPFVYQINNSVINKSVLLIENVKKKLELIDILMKNINQEKIILSDQIISTQKLINDGNFEIDNMDKSDYDISLKNISEKINNLSFENQKKIFDKNIADIDDQIKQILQNLANIDYKSIQLNETDITIINKNIFGLDEQINKLQKEIENIQDIQKQSDDLNVSQNIYNKTVLELINADESISEKLQKVNSDLENLGINNLLNYEKILSDIANIIHKIKYIYEQFQNDIFVVKKLEEEEKIVKDLVNVFGKELMLLILQNDLPHLEVQINAFLSTIVNYEVRFAIREGGEKMEINIKDGNIFREVKSLSGGQKAILRLAWILAISKRSHNKFLFLDETINNLDADNISSVAELIKDFVLQNDIKFYSITHSTQIQSMAIRDQIINIKEQLEK